MTAKNWDQFTENIKETNKLLANMFDFDDNYQLPEGELLPYNNVLRSQQVIIESDHLTEFTGSVGLYLNLPLGPHFNLGTKALVGRSITQELDINSRVQGEVTNLNYQLLIKNGEVVSDESYITNIEGTGTLYDEEWDILTMGGQNSTSFGTGLSLTYNYKSNFSWRLFVDYDYTNRAYTLKYNPIHFMSIAMPNAVSFFESFGFDLSPTEYEKKVKTNYFTFGAAFAVNF